MCVCVCVCVFVCVNVCSFSSGWSVVVLGLYFLTVENCIILYCFVLYYWNVVIFISAVWKNTGANKSYTSRYLYCDNWNTPSGHKLNGRRLLSCTASMCSKSEMNFPICSFIFYFFITARNFNILFFSVRGHVSNQRQTACWNNTECVDSSSWRGKKVPRIRHRKQREEQSSPARSSRCF